MIDESYSLISAILFFLSPSRIFIDSLFKWGMWAYGLIHLPQCEEWHRKDELFFILSSGTFH